YFGSGTIDNSFASGNITGAGYVGGLVGYNNGTINTSYASGTVNGSGSYVGGLVGHTQNTSNSYAIGNVTGGEYVGSLVGYINNNVSNSYAVGTVTSEGDYVGGLIGFDDDGHSYSYYLNSTSGTDEGQGIPRTNAEMKTQATFQPGEGDWDFDDIWGIDTTLVKNDGYPYLQWELYPGTPVASPTAGTYSSAQTISFTSTGSSFIRYSTVATPADCSSGTLYSTPISVSASQTLFVRACNNIGNSSIKDFSYTISAPVSRGGGGGGSSNLPVVITPPVNNIPVVCKTGEIFSTVTGQRCTTWEENTKGNTNRVYNFGNVTLKLGSRGEAVKELQRFLNDNLNLGLIVDGKLGPKTIAVIKKWQKEHGLVPDGLVGKKTKDMMNGKI
ncbi:peptidoglycan-binding protein, partial [Candidatus Nomurabacteria bacterium]|nr:peptidoglycan-binding protein [Candidatus Nomurabacteria bacterium]